MISESHARVVDARVQSPPTIRRHHWILHLVFLALVLPLLLHVWGTNLPPKCGSSDIHSEDPVEYGFINAANGNLHLEIPVASFPQRAVWWTKFRSSMTASIGAMAGAVGRLWRRQWPCYVGRYGKCFIRGTRLGYCAPVDDYSWAVYSPWIWTAPNGTQHSFNISTSGPIYPTVCPGTGTPSASGYASDGTGFYISITNYTTATVYAPDGPLWPTASQLCHNHDRSERKSVSMAV